MSTVDRRTLLKSLAATPALAIPAAAAVECQHTFKPMMKAESDGGYANASRAVIAWEHPFVCSKCGAEEFMSPYGGNT